jgi:tetratricopeptide (TPR) repeat protein
MSTASELKEQGLALFRQERLSEAAERFSHAAALFAAAGEAPEAAEMRNNLAVIHLADKNYAAALEAVTGTPEAFRAAGDRLREAQALSNLAAANEGLGELETAGEGYFAAIEIFTGLDERENRSACWKALSGLQIKQDKKLQALASMQAGLNLQSRKLSAREKTLKGLIDKAFKLMNAR